MFVLVYTTANRPTECRKFAVTSHPRTPFLPNESALAQPRLTTSPIQHHTATASPGLHTFNAKLRLSHDHSLLLCNDEALTREPAEIVDFMHHQVSSGISRFMIPTYTSYYLYTRPTPTLTHLAFVFYLSTHPLSGGKASCGLSCPTGLTPIFLLNFSHLCLPNR